MRINSWIMVALIAGFGITGCGEGAGPESGFAPGDDSPNAQLGKADGATDCDRLAEAIAELQRAAEEGDRRAWAEAEELAAELERLHESGACDREQEVVPVAAEKRCAVDVNRNGYLDVPELFGESPQRCSPEEVMVSCGPRPVRPQPVEPGRSLGRGVAGAPRVPVFLSDFLKRFMEWIKSLGIHERDYDADDYDCDDFASDLEEEIEAAGDAVGLPGLGTFTYVACNFDAEAGNYTEAHALTDVHLFGQIFWVEPQTAQIANLDTNGDGVVTYATDFDDYPTPTEDHADADKDCFVAVFDSAEAAVAAGLTLD